MNDKEIREACLDELTEEDRSRALQICTELLDLPCEACPLYTSCKQGSVPSEAIAAEQTVEDIRLALERMGAACVAAIERIAEGVVDFVERVAEAVAKVVIAFWSKLNDWLEGKLAELGGKEYYYYRHAKKKRVRKKYRKRLLARLFGDLEPP